MKYGLEEMSNPVEDDNMSRRSSTSSEDSFEIVSAETFESPKNEMSSSFVPSVTFSEMFDTYPMDSDIIARISFGDDFQKSGDDIIVVLPMIWSTVEQAVCVSKVVDGYVKFDVNELPKDDRCCYQLCYCATKRKTVVGVSIPFSFREVREEELMDFQKESNKEFYTFRSRFAILMDIHWNTVSRLKNNVSCTETKSTNSNQSSFVDVQESIQAANDDGKLKESLSFVSNDGGQATCVNLLELADDVDEVESSFRELVLSSSIDTNTIEDRKDDSIETGRVEEDTNTPTYSVELGVEQNKLSSSTSVETEESDSTSKLENVSGTVESIKIRKDDKEPELLETAKPSVTEITPEVNEMYCSAKDFQEFENANDQVVQIDTQETMDEAGTHVDSQIQDFMSELTHQLIATDYFYRQMRECRTALQHFYSEQWKLKQELAQQKEEEYARRLVNVTIEKQNILQSYVEYKISSENRLKEGAKMYAKLYLKWKKLLRERKIQNGSLQNTYD